MAMARDDKIRREEMEYALEMKRMEIAANASRPASSTSERVNDAAHKIQLVHITPKFDEKKDEMGLYLINFERRATMALVPKEHWVAYLLSVLPSEIANMMAREPPEKANDYDYVRECILQRYKLNTEKLRQLFYRHQKVPEKTWKNYAYELNSYFEEWIADLEVTTFDQLKDLIVADQIKRRVPMEVKEHFLDSWMKIKSPSELANKIDEYESLRESFKRKEYPIHPKPKNDFRSQTGYQKPTPAHSLMKVDSFKDKNREKEYERRKQLQCYECSSYDHLRPQCPKLQKRFEKVASNKTVEDEPEDFLAPYTSQGQVNGIQISILRDTGASVDLVGNKFVKQHMFTGEYVWIKTPLSETNICLPLAEIELDCKFGHIITKAAVLGDSLNQNTYLLGNKTAKLLTNMKEDKLVQEHMVNAVQTRAQKKILEVEKEKEINSKQSTSNEKIQEKLDDLSDEYDEILPKSKEKLIISDLVKTTPEEFRKEQLQSEDLKPLFEEAEKNASGKGKYIVENQMLFFKRTDKDGTERKLLIVPEKFREQLKKICHEETAAHLGETKTKDALVKQFFWPNCYKDIDNYVQSCDECQRVGKPRDKKRAPLKLVPIIPEIFTKINVDACGPLPITPSGKRYLITALCLSSKYPDAIPVENISSTTVVDALLQIFSRMGFPRELQCDQGTSFVSALTTEFLEKFGIKVVHSSVQHPQSNPVERMHRTLKRILRVLCIESSKDWEKYLPHALFALRTVVHTSTGFTPAELVHGRNLRTPMTLIYENLVEFEGKESSVVEYVFDLVNRMKKCQELAVKHMEDSQKKQKLYYDKASVKREFKENDLVLVIAPSRPNKLSVQWIGPGTVVKRLSDTNYVISLEGRDKTHVYHVNMLKPYFNRPEKLNLLCLQESPNTEIDEDFPCIELNHKMQDITQILLESRVKDRLNDEQIEELRTLLSQYVNIFSNEPGCTKLVEHDIELISDQPIRSKPYRMSPRQTDILKAEVDKMLNLKVIEAGESDFTSPLILVEVPGKDPRPCIDYRRLNKMTRTQFFPLPNIEQRVEVVSSAKYITLLDLTRGYWQIPLSRKAQRYASFVTTFGTFRPLRMPFGLKNAPYYFSRMMSEILKNCEDFAVPYLDDIAIYSQTWPEHLQHLDCVLKRIHAAQLHVKPSKCKFAESHVKYLGHLVGQGQRSPGELKIQAVKNFPQPSTKTEIRAFLGLAGYYRQYIPEFSVIAAPLTDLLKGKSRKGTVIWSETCQNAFMELKTRLSQNPVLYAPDYNKQFILQCDASNFGIGVVLSQKHDNDEEHPVLFLSKKFTETEQKYSTTEKECAAIIYAVKKLNCYLDGTCGFIIQTDHNPLVWLQQNTGTNPRLLRWALTLQHLNFEVVHRKGTLHTNADSLSRIK